MAEHDAPDKHAPVAGNEMEWVTDWRAVLPDEACRVLFKEATEPPHSSPLNGEKRDGVFICAACHRPLFAAGAKFESGTGWPSFFDALPEGIATREDRSFFMRRTEYHCADCGGHQGHVFNDGPAPTGLRYCNNGLALRFIPTDSPLPARRQLTR